MTQKEKKTKLFCNIKKLILFCFGTVFCLYNRPLLLVDIDCCPSWSCCDLLTKVCTLELLSLRFLSLVSFFFMLTDENDLCFENLGSENASSTTWGSS